MQKRYDSFRDRDIAVIAIAQEDSDLESHGRFLKHFDGEPPFDIVCDVNGEKTGRYHRTTAYLIDKEGVVRQVFPMLARSRPSWDAILNEIDRLNLGK
ncbi:MAG: redoxin domain-containing protein [Phycisphaerae bacterium]|nr:redoxin domain-containing protein [Phycisphaerae bacterium]